MSVDITRLTREEKEALAIQLIQQRSAKRGVGGKALGRPKPTATSRPSGGCCGGVARAVRRGAKFAVAAAKHVAAGSPTVSAEVQAHRIALCQVCEHFDAQGRECKVCECLLDVKTTWADQRCPLDPPKWDTHAETKTAAP